VTALYPWIEDWDGHVESLLPAPAAIGDSLSVVLAFAWPWSVMESALQELAVGLVDLGAAVPWVLEVAGLRVNEPPGGLGTTEYRRLVEGRRLSLGSDATSSAVWLVWLGLTGADVGSATQTPLPPAGLALAALVAFTPSAPWLSRAGGVLRDAVDASTETEAILATATTARWDMTPWTDAATWAYDL
jgi:hypothetical protein